MGGRGTFAAGNPVPYTYQAVDLIEGIKVLVGIEGKHGLPEEAHTSSAYISLHHDGRVKQLRLYNAGLTAKTDIEYAVPIEVLLGYADYFGVSMDYITCRCDEPQSKLYQARPPISDNPELGKFIEMCFDPQSPMNERLKEALFRMMEGGK